MYEMYEVGWKISLQPHVTNSSWPCCSVVTISKFGQILFSHTCRPMHTDLPILRSTWEWSQMNLRHRILGSTWDISGRPKTTWVDLRRVSGEPESHRILLLMACHTRARRAQLELEARVWHAISNKNRWLSRFTWDPPQIYPSGLR